MNRYLVETDSTSGSLQAAQRRGACPTLSSPMRTGDGLLARLRPTTAGLTPAQWIDLANLSRRLGNGLLDVTARGNLQIRGLSEHNAPLLAQALDEAGLFSHSGVVVETPALAGLDASELANAEPLAERIREAIKLHASLKLAPKLSIIVDGGGQYSLSKITADIRLDAVRQPQGELLWRIALAGDAFSARPVARANNATVVGHVMALLKRLAALGPSARGRDLPDDLVATVGEDTARLPQSFTVPSVPVGPFDIGNCLVLGLRLPYGRMRADWIKALMTDLAGLGATQARLSPYRAILILGLTKDTLEQAIVLARINGFLTDPADPANVISACPGLSGCATALIDSHAIAQALLDKAPSLLDGSADVHVSGCTKGCAHPATAPLTIVGTDNGIGLVVNGPASHAPDVLIEPLEIPRAFQRLNTHHLQNRQATDTALAFLQRVQPEDLMDIIKGKT